MSDSGQMESRFGKKTENFELSEEILIDCKESFKLFDLDSSGRINSGLVTRYLSQVPEGNMIHYLLGGLEKLGEEVSYQDYLSHIRMKLRNSVKETSYQVVCSFIDEKKEKEVTADDLKQLADKLNIGLSDKEIAEVVDRLVVSDNHSEF